jgi:MFS family permease
MDGYTSIAYVIVAVTFSNIFFPANFSDALLLTFLGLGVGAVARFIGSIILGNFLGDRLGRRKMLIYSIMGFSIFSFLIAFLPTYSTVGYISTALLYSLLFLVGLFAGAEYAGGTALSMESVSQRKRMPVGAFVQSGYGVGYFIILLVASGLRAFLGPAQNDDLVWRILFATTIIPGLIALVIRLSSRESPVFTEMEEKNELEKIPVVGMIRERRVLVSTFLIAFGLLLLNTVTLSYYPTLLGIIHPSIACKPQDDLYNSYINLVSLAGVWIGGFIAFYIFRRKLTLSIFAIIFLISIFPLYLLAFSGNITYTVVAFSVQALFEAAIFSTIPAFLAEVFMKSHRATSIGAIYNGGAVPASFGISAVIFFSGSRLFGALGSSWVIFLFIGSIILIIGIATSRESASLKSDPINN